MTNAEDTRRNRPVVLYCARAAAQIVIGDFKSVAS